MRITCVEPTPFAEIPYLNALKGGRIEEVALPLFRGQVAGLPPELDGLVAAADLQGRESTPTGPGRLLGERLADELVRLAVAGAVPDPARTGVLLAGDLYTVPQLERRGGAGDPSSVWRAFANRFRWVAGVAGNHDDYGGRTAGAVGDGGEAYLLDGDTVSLDRLKIGGVGGIVGSPTRLNRKPAARFQHLFERVLEGRPEVLVCHEGPDFPRLRARGNSALRELLELWAAVAEGGGAPLPLVVCGHCWWPEVMVELTGGVQVLKVDARAVVLTRASGN